MMLRSVCFFSLGCLISFSVLADPSGRVAQVSSLRGAVTLIHPSSGEAQLASLNWPITSDNELVTDDASRAEIRLGTTAIRLGSNTDLTIVQVDDAQLHLRLNRGSVQLHARYVGVASALTLDIPQGRLAFPEPANVRVDTRDGDGVTAINVLSGAPYFDDGISRFTISAGRRAEVDSGGLRVMESRDNFRGDSFDTWIAERDRQDEVSIRSRYVSSDVTGYQVLNSYGAWRTTTTYGPIWSPTVIPVGWAPYRDGRWTWIAPWGWTWVDNAPWGYAPSHYGRWVFYQQRWCWTPGVIGARPVWAPALVGWVGGDGNNYSDYRDGPAIGWFPLAPREVYVPSYQATPQYVQLVNNGYLIGRGASYSPSGRADPRTTPYQNQLIRNATTILPSYQFGTGKTVTVTPSSQRGERAQLLHNTNTVISAPSLYAPPNGQLSSSSATPSLSSAIRDLQLKKPAAPIATSPITRPASVQITTPRQSSYPGWSTVVVRPLQAMPVRQLPATPLAVPRPATQFGEHALAPPAYQKRDAGNKLSPDQQRRILPGSNGAPDNAAARYGFGRGSLQR